MKRVYTQTVINQIIEEANVSKASLYHHFKSKEDIAVIYLQRRHLVWMSSLNYCTIGKKNSKEKIIAIFDYLDSWLLDVHFRGCGWQNISTELPLDYNKIKEQVFITKSETRKWLHIILKEDKHYNHNEASQLGGQIFVLMEGAIILSQLQKK
jgi:AcrR family transcriptional regulator